MLITIYTYLILIHAKVYLHLYQLSFSYSYPTYSLSLSSTRVDSLQVLASLLLFLDPSLKSSLKPWLIHATTSLFLNILSYLPSSIFLLFCRFAPGIFNTFHSVLSTLSKAASMSKYCFLSNCHFSPYFFSYIF